MNYRLRLEHLLWRVKTRGHVTSYESELVVLDDSDDDDDDIRIVGLRDRALRRS